MAMSALAMILVVVTSPGASSDDESPILALGGLDPVALVAGKEVAGAPGRSVTVGKYRYLFESDESRRIFETDRDSYRIQLAGSCARMGLLTGLGDPRRFTVHDKRIYLFASDACRSAFEKEPGRYLEATIKAPAGSPTDAMRGRELLTKAVEAIGGADRLRELERLTIETKHQYGSGTSVTEGEHTTTMIFPDSYRVEEDWGTSRYADATDGKRGMRYGRETFEMEVAEVEHLVRQCAQQPLMILRASITPSSGLAAFARGIEEHEGREVQLVEVWWQGAATVLGLDESHRVVFARVAEAKQARTTQRETRFGDFRDVEGFSLPFEIKALVDGKPVDQPKVVVKGYRPSDDTSTTLFVEP